MRLNVRASLALGFIAMSSGALAQDRLYQSDEAYMAEFNGRPMWANAALCAAYEEDTAASAAPPEITPSMSEADRLRLAAYHRALVDGARRMRSFWTTFGTMRLERDRPGQPASSMFEAQVVVDMAEHRRLARAEAEQEAFEGQCSEFRSDIDWVLIRMQRGWADQ